MKEFKMLSKLKFYDKNILRKFYSVLTIISTILTIVLFSVEIPAKCKILIGIFIVVISIVIYVTIWIRENFRKKIVLNIDNSRLVVKIGDLFAEENLKVIGVNEYYDNIVSDKMISKNSLHGKYILKNYQENTENLDNRILNDTRLNELKTTTNDERKEGKKQKYRLGSIFIDDDFILTAFAKFDQDNRAYLYMNDYINFLLDFWNEIDIIYGERPISIPLFGSGITRFKGYDIPEQELLELIIWSFKVSKIKFKYPSQMTIVIDKNKARKINFTKLKEWDNNGL